MHAQACQSVSLCLASACVRLVSIPPLSPRCEQQQQHQSFTECMSQKLSIHMYAWLSTRNNHSHVCMITHLKNNHPHPVTCTKIKHDHSHPMMSTHRPWWTQNPNLGTLWLVFAIYVPITSAYIIHWGRDWRTVTPRGSAASSFHFRGRVQQAIFPPPFI
jgi:hypothetical protein